MTHKDKGALRFGLWNNKGGVGKTFLSFILGTEYAKKNSETKVILADMCPQANLSEIVLGGDRKGREHLSAILAMKEKRKTVGGYLESRISSPHQLTRNETSFLLHANKYNDKIPQNLFLLCGDPSLEIQAQVINQIGSQTLPVNAWKNVHDWLKDLILACERKLGQNNILVLIDCNPSFAAYTELAMIASDRLIIPCSSDGSSARAVNNVATLLYGDNLNNYYTTVNFSTRAKDSDTSLPLIHAVVLNRSTQYDKKASKAFSAMFSAIKSRIIEFHGRASKYFVAEDPENLFNDPVRGRPRPLGRGRIARG